MAGESDLKGRAEESVRRWEARLLEVSHAIHARPELGFEERFASALLCDVLDEAGLEVERGAHGIETAFRASAGRDGPLVAVICEYDALPGVGHACGHNVIAAAGLGAGLALAELAAEAGGRVLVLGTPAEEGGGGKALLVARGALDGVAAAMMVHPAGLDAPWFPSIALQRIEVAYRGAAAHAAARPEEGRNALDAAVLGYMGVAALRQHIGERERVHGIFTAAGDSANVVPDRAATEWFARAPTIAQLEALVPRVLAALEAGASATGCEVEHTLHPAYAELRTSTPLIERYAANAAAIGRPLAGPGEAQTVGTASTDMGNVSQLVPSIHPLVRIADRDVALHSPAFAACARGPEADRAIVDAATAMAMTGLDLWAAPDVLAAARAELDAAVGT